mgnify:CR=1 FL=1
MPHDVNDEAKVEDAEKLSSKHIFEIIRRDGHEELDRPNGSLFWSGIAAGLMISLSVLGEAIFRTYLPDAEWRYLLENLGYSLGFLVVILGRMQLFTENTITTVLPVMRNPVWPMFKRLLILWTIVLSANVIGAFLVATAFANGSFIPAEDVWRAKTGHLIDPFRPTIQPDGFADVVAGNAQLAAGSGHAIGPKVFCWRAVKGKVAVVGKSCGF